MTQPVGSQAPRRAWRVMLLALLVTGMLGTAMLGGTAVAQVEPSVASLGLEVTVGYADQMVPGTWTPMEVLLAPDHPFRGRILLAVDGDTGSSLQRLPVEVPATGTKAFRFLLPPSSAVRLQVVEDGADAGVTVRPRVNVARGVLVGVLAPTSTDAIPTLTSPITDQRVQPVPVPEELLALGPRVLEPLGTVIVEHAALQALAPQARAALASATADGLNLVVVNPLGPDLGLPWTPIFALDASTGITAAPAAWSASTAALLGDGAVADEADGARAVPSVAAVRAGRGRLIAVRALPAADADPALWEPLLQSAAGRGAITNRALSELAGRATSAFGSDDAGRLPSMALVAAFLLAYLIIAGPVNGAVVTRLGRRELAWVTIPAITLVFAVAAFFGAAGARPGLGSATRAAWWIDGEGTVMALTGVRAPRQGLHTVELVGAWDVTPVFWGAGTTVEHGADTEVELRLEALQIGVVAGWQRTEVPAPLLVEAAILDGELHVEVTNASTSDLTDVRIHYATDDRSLVGELAAGATHVDSISVADVLPIAGPWFLEERGQFDPRGMPIKGADSLLGALKWDPITGAPGLIWVTAQATDDLGLGTALVDGSTPAEAGTLVAVAVTPAATDDVTSPLEVQRDLIGGLNGFWQPSPLAIEGSTEALLRFRLPREATLAALDFSLDRGDANGFAFDAPDVVVEVPCHRVDIRDAEGNLLETSESCDPPQCDGTTISCSSTLDETEICRADGTCETHQGVDFFLSEDQLAPAPPRVGVFGLQVWDRVEERWVDLDGTLGIGRTTDIGRWLSPLGEVFVRFNGQVDMVDFSGRGIGGIPTGTA